MRSIAYGILVGFLLMVLCVFPTSGSAQGLSDASVKYADSVAVHYENALIERGYEPDGQSFAIQVSIALRYRMFKSEPVDAPVSVMAIKEGDPMILMVSKVSQKHDEVATIDSSNTMTAPLASDDNAVSDSSDTTSERIGKKIGEYLSSNGYTGVREAIDHQATGYLKAHSLSDEEAKHVLVPVKVIRDGRLMTIRISADKLESASPDVPHIVNVPVRHRHRIATNLRGKRVAHAGSIRASHTANHGIAAVPAIKAKTTKGNLDTSIRTWFSILIGNHAIVTNAPWKERSRYGFLKRQDDIGKSVVSGSPFKVDIPRSLSRHRVGIRRIETSEDARIVRPPNITDARLTRSEVLRN